MYAALKRAVLLSPFAGLPCLTAVAFFLAFWSSFPFSGLKATTGSVSSSPCLALATPVYDTYPASFITLMMEAIYSYKLLVCAYQTKWCHNSEYYNMKLSLVLYFISVLKFYHIWSEQWNRKMLQKIN